MKKLFSFIICAALFSFAACGGGGGSGGVSYIDVNTLDGQTDIAVTSQFRYTFASAIDPTTLTTTSYFIVPTQQASVSLPPASKVLAKAAIDTTICNSANAIPASVDTGGLSTNVTLGDIKPSSNLAGNTEYSVCLTTDIKLADGSAFGGFMATFNTGDHSTGPTSSLLTIKNQCSYTIWVQQQNMPSATPEVVEITSGSQYTYNIPNAGQASTRFWPKTGCDSTGQNCTIGQSSDPCTNCPPPVDSKLEATWGCSLSDQTKCAYTPQGDRIGDTYWNMSAVDGYTLPFTATITGNTITDSGAPCDPVNCSGLAFNQCPTDIDLSVGQGGSVDPALANVDLQVLNGASTQIGCYSPCKVLNYPTYGGKGLNEDSTQAIMYCCPTPPISSAECQAGPGASNAYVTAIHTMCSNSTYAYAYDDTIGLRHCSAATEVEVTFGPNCP